MRFADLQRTDVRRVSDQVEVIDRDGNPCRFYSLFCCREDLSIAVRNQAIGKQKGIGFHSLSRRSETYSDGIVIALCPLPPRVSEAMNDCSSVCTATNEWVFPLVCE